MGTTFYYSAGIKLGYVQMVLGFLCFVIGIASPAWTESDWVLISQAWEHTWYGPWWYCDISTGQTSSPVVCHALDVSSSPPGDVLALLVLSAVSALCYVITFGLSSVLICCCRSPGNAGKWKLVSVLAMIAGLAGLGSVIVFSMSTTANVYIFGFYLTMAGAFLAVTGGFTFAWSQLRYWRFKLGTPVSAANWDDLPPPYRHHYKGHRHHHANSVATWESGYEFPYSGYKIGTHAGTAQWVAYHS